MQLESIRFELESFVYFKKWQVDLLPIWRRFLLDSGAFTFINAQRKKSKQVDFDEFLNKYINFINEYDIRDFFELDVDSVVGYPKVLEYRKRLESQTRKKCIPVWHKSRGVREWCRMVREYDRVAIGGFAIKEITKNEYGMINSFIRVAHRHNCKVHGLGFTRTKELPKYHFDSVDSTSWKSGGRFGQLHTFNGQAIETSKPQARMHWKDIDSHNLTEWNKYVKYAETHL